MDSTPMRVRTPGVARLFWRLSQGSQAIQPNLVKERILDHCRSQHKQVNDVVAKVALAGTSPDGSIDLSTLDNGFQNDNTASLFRILFGSPEDEPEHPGNRDRMTPLPDMGSPSVRHATEVRRTLSGALEETYSSAGGDFSELLSPATPRQTSFDLNSESEESEWHPYSPSEEDELTFERQRERSGSIASIQMRKRLETRVSASELPGSDVHSMKYRALEGLFDAECPPDTNRIGSEELYNILVNPALVSTAGHELAVVYRKLPASFFLELFSELDFENTGGLDKDEFMEAFSVMFDDDGRFFIPKDALGSQVRALFKVYLKILETSEKDKAKLIEQVQECQHKLKNDQNFKNYLEEQLRVDNEKLDQLEQQLKDTNRDHAELQSMYALSSEQETALKRQVASYLMEMKRLKHNETLLQEEINNTRENFADLERETNKYEQDVRKLLQQLQQADSQQETVQAEFLRYIETHPSRPSSARSTPGNSRSKLEPMDLGGTDRVRDLELTQSLICEGIEMLLRIVEYVADGSDVQYSSSLIDEISENLSIDEDCRTQVMTVERQLKTVMQMTVMLAKKSRTVREQTLQEAAEELAELRARNEALQANNVRLENDASNASRADNEVKKLKEQIELLNSEQLRLHGKDTEARIAKQKLADLQDMYNDLNTKLAQVVCDNEDLSNSAIASKSEIKIISSQLQTALTEIEIHKQAFMERTAERDTLSQELEAANSAKHKLAAASAAGVAAEEELAIAMLRYSDIANELEETRKVKNTAEKALSSLSTKCNTQALELSKAMDLEKMLQEERTQTGLLKSRLASAFAEKRQAENELAKQSSKFDSLNLQLESMQSACDRLVAAERAVTISEKAKKDLENECAVLMSELDKQRLHMQNLGGKMADANLSSDEFRKLYEAEKRKNGTSQEVVKDLKVNIESEITKRRVAEERLHALEKSLDESKTENLRLLEIEQSNAAVATNRFECAEVAFKVKMKQANSIINNLEADKLRLKNVVNELQVSADRTASESQRKVARLERSLLRAERNLADSKEVSNNALKEYRRLELENADLHAEVQLVRNEVAAMQRTLSIRSDEPCESKSGDNIGELYELADYVQARINTVRSASDIKMVVPITQFEQQSDEIEELIDGYQQVKRRANEHKDNMLRGQLQKMQQKLADSESKVNLMKRIVAVLEHTANQDGQLVLDEQDLTDQQANMQKEQDEGIDQVSSRDGDSEFDTTPIVQSSIGKSMCSSISIPSTGSTIDLCWCNTLAIQKLTEENLKLWEVARSFAYICESDVKFQELLKLLC